MDVVAQFRLSEPLCEHVDGSPGCDFEWDWGIRPIIGVVLVISCPTCHKSADFDKNHYQPILTALQRDKTDKKEEPKAFLSIVERDFSPGDAIFLKAWGISIPDDLLEKIKKSYYAHYYLSKIARD